MRRIIRAVDIYSRHLNDSIGLTTPQLICLQRVVEHSNLTLSLLTREVSLSASTVTGIADRLEAKGLLTRERAPTDRRKIYLRPTDSGKEIVKKSPSLLQDKLSTALSRLEIQDQLIIAESLEKIVKFMEAENVDASPNLISNR